VREALTVRDKPRDDGTGRLARTCNGHLNVIAFGEAPHYLTDLVTGQHLHRRTFDLVLFHYVRSLSFCENQVDCFQNSSAVYIISRNSAYVMRFCSIESRSRTVNVPS